MASVTRRQHVVLEGFREMLDRTAPNQVGLHRECSHSHDLLRLGVNPTMRRNKRSRRLPKEFDISSNPGRI